MALSTSPYKGTRDFYPEEKRFQKWMFNKLRDVVESYGYEEYDAPIIEPLEIYLSKTSSEIVNEQTYVFKDRGGRDVVVRPEMTPSVSRMVAGRRQELGYPLRLYSIPNLWRYERPQKGRLREHWQLNVDIFGISNLSAEHELIVLSRDILERFGAKPSSYKIRINSRKLINYIFLDYLGLNDLQTSSLIKLIDHIGRMDYTKFTSDVGAIVGKSKQNQGVVDRLLEVLASKSLSKLPKEVQEHESLKNIQSLMVMLDESKVTNYIFDITLMRGFDYYTDIVFEVFDTNPDNNRAMMGGGRYDGLVGLFGVEPVPTVGFGLGDVTLTNFLEIHKLLPKIQSETDVYVVIIGDVYQKALSKIDKLRSAGLNVSVDGSANKVDKQIRNAVKHGVNFVVFIGDKELQEEKLKVKVLSTSKESYWAVDRLVDEVKKLS